MCQNFLQNITMAISKGAQKRSFCTVGSKINFQYIQTVVKILNPILRSFSHSFHVK